LVVHFEVFSDKRVDKNKQMLQSRIESQLEEYGILNTLSVQLQHFHPTNLQAAKKTVRTFLNSICEGIEEYKYGIVTKMTGGGVGHHWIASFSSENDLQRVKGKLTKNWRKGDAQCLSGAELSKEEIKERFSNEYYQSAAALCLSAENSRLHKSKLFHFSRN